MENQNKSSVRAARSLIKFTLEGIQQRFNCRSQLPGLETGLIDLDRITLGLRPGHLHIVAARPGMGKTSFCLTLIKNMCIGKQYPTLFLSLQNSIDAMMQALLTCCAQIDSARVRSGYLKQPDKAYLEKAGLDISVAPLYIADSNLLWSEVEENIRELAAASEGLEVVFVDDLLAAHEPAPDAIVIKPGYCYKLKCLAQELSICIIATVPVSVDSERRTNKRPMLCDLPEVLSDIDYADLIFFIYRDEMYDTGTPARGQAELILARNRYGQIGTVDLKFQASIHTFSDCEPDTFPVK